MDKKRIIVGISGASGMPLALELLRQLQETQGLTVVMNSHNVEQAMAFSQQVVGLRQGRILFQGPADVWDEEKLRGLYRRES